MTVSYGSEEFSVSVVGQSTIDPAFLAHCSSIHTNPHPSADPLFLKISNCLRPSPLGISKRSSVVIKMTLHL